MQDFRAGDKVTLTPSMKRAAKHPEKYEVGVVTGVGAWSNVYVKWNGIDRVIGVLSHEIVHL